MWLFVLECLIGAVVVLCTYIYLYGRKAFRYFKDRGVKNMKPVVLFGNSLETMLGRKHSIYALDEYYNAFPDERLVGMYEFFTPVFMIRDPELIKQITVKDFDHFVDHRSVFDDPDEVFSSNLVSLKGDQWRLMRSTLSPAFTGSKMRQMFPFIVECAEQVVSYLKTEWNKKINEEPSEELQVELKDLFTRFSNDVIANTAFGYQVNSLVDRENKFFMTGKKMSTFKGFQVARVYFIVLFPKLCRWLKISIFPASVTGFFKSIFQNAVRYRKENNIVRTDMLNILMDAQKGTLKFESHAGSDDAGFATVEESEIGKQQQKRKWNDNELAAQAFIFFFAGFETVSNLLAFAVHELMDNPDIQEKLREEIDAVFTVNDVLTYEIIQKMTYLDMVISEILRLWAPAVITDRLCVKSYEVPDKDGQKSGLTIDKNTTIYIPMRALGRDPKYWEDPEKFDPERFSSENKHKINPFAYLPFGAGPRNCIGSRYALMEIKAIICHLLRNFVVQRTAKTPKELIFPANSFTMLPGEGFWLKFVPREGKTI